MALLINVLPYTFHEIYVSGNTIHYPIHVHGGTVAKSSAKGLVVTVFGSWNRLKPRAGL